MFNVRAADWPVETRADLRPVSPPDFEGAQVADREQHDPSSDL